MFPFVLVLLTRHKMQRVRAGVRVRTKALRISTINAAKLKDLVMKHFLFLSTSRLLVATLLCLQSLCLYAEEDRKTQRAAIDLFNQRIMPIFRSPNPSSCVQCHLSSVDLKSYILPSHEETFLSLRDQGLIDLDSPADSKILKLISMGEKDADKGARLIHEKTRQAEYDAFAAWIEACCADASLRSKPAAKDFRPARPSLPDDVIRHGRKSRLVDSFVRNIWSQRMRCFPCHTPHEIESPEKNPQHEKAAQRHKELVAKYGQRMNIFRETPEQTLQQMIVSSRKSTSRRLPMLNLKEPRKSLLVLKPTSKLPPKKEDGQFESPSSVEPVSHMGGLKMHVDDQSYKSFVAWIQDYANVVDGRYQSVEDLPADNWHPTMSILRLKDCPEDWPVGTPVQLFVHAWNEEAGKFDDDAVAFTQGTVTPRRIVNGALFVLSDSPTKPGSAGARPLSSGGYRIAVYVDQQRRIAKDPALLLGKQELKGHIKTDAKWLEGFRQAELISCHDLSQ